eukprot:358948_1
MNRTYCTHAIDRDVNKATQASINICCTWLMDQHNKILVIDAVSYWKSNGKSIEINNGYFDHLSHTKHKSAVLKWRMMHHLKQRNCVIFGSWTHRLLLLKRK